MSENIIKHATGTVIMNGGDPLPGCPENWDQAWKIQNEFLNEGKWKHGDWKDNPVWSFDCGYKLDYDGPLVKISSRFYPPKSHYGPNWDGSVDVVFMGKDMSTKEFDCSTFEELKLQVETYVKGIVDKLKTFIEKEL